MAKKSRVYCHLDYWIQKSQKLGYNHPDDAIVSLFEQGNSPYRIAQLFEVYKGTIVNRLRMLGKTIVPRICQYAIHGRSLIEVSQETGMSYNDLYNRKKLGWSDDDCLSPVTRYF